MHSGTLYSDEYATAAMEPKQGVIRYARTATPFPSLDDMRAHYAALLRTMTGIEPEKLALLLDLRAAPPRNDAAFETEAARAVGTLAGPFRVHAFLVKTAVGSLQVRRLSANNGTPAKQVFTDETAALAFLTANERNPSLR
ncbi:MAG TPA: hypothetical protein VHC69_30380 [Polyangiaceae bacterium]|nr:hypothetical protein [Polyangiaceae bacterium]